MSKLSRESSERVKGKGERDHVNECVSWFGACVRDHSLGSVPT